MSGATNNGPAPRRLEQHEIDALQDGCDLPSLVAPFLAGALRKTGREYKGPCPLCSRSKSLTVFRKTNRWRWYCHGCTEGHGAIDWLTKVAGMGFLDAVRALGGDPDALRRSEPSPEVRRRAQAAKEQREAEERADAERRRRAAWDVWQGRQPVAGSPAERYLEARGLRGPWPASLGFHEQVWTIRPAPTETDPDAEERVAFPAMLACVTSGDRRFLAVHRIFLAVNDDGSVTKAKGLPVDATKRALGDLCDGAVRLTRRPKSGGTLALTEGVETGEAVAQALRRVGRLAESGGDAAVWSALFAGQLCRIGFGPDPFWRPSRIVVMADNDPKSKTGETKAIEACRRFQGEFGIPSAWSMPNRPGWDWNDPLIKTTEVN